MIFLPHTFYLIVPFPLSVTKIHDTQQCEQGRVYLVYSWKEYRASWQERYDGSRKRLIMAPVVRKRVNRKWGQSIKSQEVPFLSDPLPSLRFHSPLPTELNGRQAKCSNTTETQHLPFFKLSSCDNKVTDALSGEALGIPTCSPTEVIGTLD